MKSPAAERETELPSRSELESQITTVVTRILDPEHESHSRAQADKLRRLIRSDRREIIAEVGRKRLLEHPDYGKGFLVVFRGTPSGITYNAEKLRSMDAIVVESVAFFSSSTQSAMGTGITLNHEPSQQRIMIDYDDIQSATGVNLNPDHMHKRPMHTSFYSRFLPVKL